MKRILAALALLLIPSVAMSAWNIRQNDDGTTEWVNGDGDAIPVGGVHLSLTVTDLSTAATHYIPSPVNGEIRDVVSVLGGTGASTGGDTVLRLYTSPAASADGTDPNQFTPVTSTTDLVKLTVSQGSSAGMVDQMGGFSTYAVSASDITGTDVDERGVIAVHTDGGNSDQRPATVIITVYPK